VIAADKNSTIVFPLPLDIIGPLLHAVTVRNADRDDERRSRGESAAAG
jgi:hypothetical protein